VTVTTGGTPPPTGQLPSGWTSRDVGSTGSEGTASHDDGVFTVRGAGDDVWGTSDEFHYAYRSLSGDGAIVARVASLAGTEAWTKVGVMMRASTAVDAAYAFAIVSKSKGLAFQRRTSNGASALHTAGGSGTAPRWVRLARDGDTITAAVSSTGSSWTTIGSDTFSMPSTMLVGLAVSSHTSSLATGVFDNVSVSTSTLTGGLPDGWTSRDVGAAGREGSASEDDGTFVVRGAGEDVWGTADAFHFAHTDLDGDGHVVARVAAVSGDEAWTKVGVMMRASEAADAAYAYMLVSKGKGVAFQRRTSEGAFAVHTSGGPGTAPRWVKLERDGDTITASVSTTGSSWTTVGSDTFSLPSSVLVGLATSSHDSSELASGTFDNVDVGGS
jgi:regulation of enolase protein 1 (concanavalin A-like superfamily)